MFNKAVTSSEYTSWQRFSLSFNSQSDGAKTLILATGDSFKDGDMSCLATFVGSSAACLSYKKCQIKKNGKNKK